MTDPHRDKQLHIRTQGTIEILQDNPHYNRYEATPYEVLDLLFTEHPLDRGDHLVDYGCGKGRVPFYCSDRFSCSITGVDLNARLLQEAYANLADFRQTHKKSGGSITFEEVKAEEYLVSPDQNVFYFFNPFSVSVFQSVIHGILQSLEAAPRYVRLLLYYPTADYMQFLDEETPFLRMDDIAIPSLSESDPDERLLVYCIG